MKNTVLWVNGQKYIFNSMTDRHTFSKISKTPLNNDKKKKYIAVILFVNNFVCKRNNG